MSNKSDLAAVREALHAGQYGEALDRLERATPTRQDAPEVAFLRGQALHGLQRFDQSVEAYSEALDLKPGWPEALFARALAWSERGEFDIALRDLAAYLQLRPKDVEAYVERADLEMILADYRSAYEDWSKAIEYSPAPTAEMYVERAKCLEAMSIDAAALFDADCAIAIDKNNVKAWEIRYSALERFEAPLEDRLMAARTLVSLAPENSLFARSLMGELFEAEDFESLEKVATPVVERDDIQHKVAALKWRARARHELGRFHGAIDDYCDAERLGEPEELDDYDYENRARCYAKLGRFHEAISDYTSALKTCQIPWTYLDRADAYSNVEDYKAALADVDRFDQKVEDGTVDDPPSTRRSLEIRAKCYEGLGMVDETARTREKLTALPPDDS